MNRLLQTGLAGIIALALSACGSSTVPTGVDGRTAGPLAKLGQQAVPDALAIANLVPGFGGYFLDEQGFPTIYLTDPEFRGAAALALSGFLKARGFSPDDIRVLSGQYDFIQLDQWHRLSYPHVLVQPGAVFSDLDEGVNRLRFGMENPAAVAAAKAIVAGLGIPDDAVIVDIAEPLHIWGTLQDTRARPVHGSYQINFFAVEGNTPSLLCTLGFNAFQDGERSFVTNAHCSNTEGNVLMPTEYYQPTRGNPEHLIATEVEDPMPETVATNPECPPGLLCRYSDSSRAVYHEGVESELGRIARTEERHDLKGTLKIDEARPSFRIVAKQADPVLGERLNKVGRTTGWTHGRVTGTCTNPVVTGATYMRLCQSTVNGGSNSGDSGSPVFSLPGNSTDEDDVTLVGILFAGPSSGTSFTFSPVSGIEKDLGELKVHD